MFYVYVLIDSRKNQPFYVGKGKGNRKFNHFSDARRGKCKNKHLERTILKLWEEGHEIPVVIAFNTESETEAFETERKLILEYGRRDLGTGSLVNLTEGGEGVTGKSKETIERNTRNASATRAKWSDEKRLALNDSISSTLKEFWKKLSAEEIKQRTNHISLRAEEKRIRENRPKKIYKSKSQAVTDMWATLTTAERIERTRNLRAGQTIESRKKSGQTKKNRILNETVEEKQKRIAAHINGAKKVDWKTINKMNANARSNWTPEQKSAYSEKMREAARKRWDNKINQ